MSSPTTRPIPERQLKERLDGDDRSRGGSIHYEDERVSKAFEWIAGITAAVVIALLVWVGSSLVDLKVETGKLSVQITPMQGQIRDLSTEVQELRGEVKQVKSQVADIQQRQQQAISR